MEDKKYAKSRMEEASKLMKQTADGTGIAYEYHKGQFLAFREIADPTYRHGI